MDKKLSHFGQCLGKKIGDLKAEKAENLKQYAKFDAYWSDAKAARLVREIKAGLAENSIDLDVVYHPCTSTVVGQGKKSKGRDLAIKEILFAFPPNHPVAPAKTFSITLIEESILGSWSNKWKTYDEALNDAGFSIAYWTENSESLS